MLASLLLAASLAASASAHATWQQLWINGLDYGSSCVRLPASNSPVTDVTSADIACNANPSAAKYVCPVAPGDSVTVEMHQQSGQRTCANEAIGGAHYGPVQVYLAKVTNATTAVGSTAGWFKISEIGLPSSNPDYWGTREWTPSYCQHTLVLTKVHFQRF